MGIIGIDHEICTKCKECIKECPSMLFSIGEGGEIIYEDLEGACIKCGHCVAVCPVDAVKYEKMGDSFEFKGIQHPEKLISYDEIYKSLTSLRSVRRYKPQKVPQELLTKVTDIMQYAPTGANMRSENITIISNKEQMKKLSIAVINALSKDKRWGPLYKEEFEVMSEHYEAPAFYDAPHVIVVYTSMPMVINHFNIGNIITYGRIAAQALGLGTCYIGWTQMAMMIDPKVKSLAKARGNVLCAFTIGYPDVKYQRIPPRSSKRIKTID